MHDRRPHKRYTVDLLDIRSALIEENDLEIVDISPKGIGIRAKRRLNIGETYTLKIRSRDTVLNLKGVVMWSKISGTRRSPGKDSVPIYTAGLEFVDVSADKRDELVNFIESHAE
ncbi:MAG: PilZ domain-containing protein, partial [Nitrospirota bacterium]